MSQPLAGLRVLDLTRFFPGGYCTLLLAQMGAEVVKVEPPNGGDPLRGVPAAHVGLNRGKRSITLDTRAAAAAGVMARLVAGADVLVESAKPGTPAVTGFGPEEAMAANPRLVWAGITGFGRDGPDAGQSGHDVTFLGRSGLLAALTDDLSWQPETMVSVPVGGLMAAFAIVSAVAGRERTGRGTVIDASLTDASTWMLSGFAQRLNGSPSGMGWSAGRRPYRCADGRYVTTAGSEDRTWRALCDGLGVPELGDRLRDPVGGQLEMAARIEAIFATRPAADWVAELGHATVGAVHDGGDDLAADPHLGPRGVLVEVDGLRVPAAPARFDGEMPGPESPPPALGADTDAILVEAGYSPAEITDLRAAGTI